MSDRVFVPLPAPAREPRSAARWMFGLRPPLCDMPYAPFGTCQWIEGEPTRHAEMCGAPSVSGMSWCAAHAARVFRDTSANRLNAARAYDPHLAFGASLRVLRWRKFDR